MSTASGPKSGSTGTKQADRMVPLLTIIGAGPAGVATGYYAQKAGLSFRVLESSQRVGGNAATLQHGPFRYDTGAHRWHDKYPDITQDVKELLGSDLMQIEVPSQIYSNGKFFDFPISPLNLFRNLGLAGIVKAAAEVMWQQWQPHSQPHSQPESNFEQVAIRNYGKSLASRFLLGYSEKLWGAPAHLLSPAIAGKRLKGLSLKTFLIEALKGTNAKTRHLDGSFYYPKLGIGTISDKMAAAMGPHYLSLGQKVTKINHHQNQITGLETTDGSKIDVNQVVSSLPLTVLLKALDPPAPQEITEVADKLQFRHLILVVLFLDKLSVTPNASVYFPDQDLPFTRMYEPRNRSPYMAPEGQTSVVIEIPTDMQSEQWQKTDQALIFDTINELVWMRFFTKDQVIEGIVHRIPFAYPILLQESGPQLQSVLNYLAGFSNLHLAGRTASFEYSHLHDHFIQAKALIGTFKKS